MTIAIKPVKSLNTSLSIVKSPLKWAGGKRLLVHRIAKLIGKTKDTRLIEPFVGGGSVFLNLDFPEYLLVDTNQDLINLFEQVKNNLPQFLQNAEAYFSPEFNCETKYYQSRKIFNASKAPEERSALFLYLNRHGYNGLCRYNLKGEYNVPFGRYKKPYFPANELHYFHQRAQQANFACGDFSIAFERAQAGDIIYCDPPYTPIGKTASFTTYSGNSFGSSEQLRLVDLAIAAKSRGITTIISNHCLKETMSMYQHANKIVKFDVARTISCKGEIRKRCKELMAIYKA